MTKTTPKKKQSTAARRRTGLATTTKRGATSRSAAGSLAEYQHKRDFSRTPEPRGTRGKSQSAGGRFVIQKHDASHLHYDFRLELDGVLKSWAIPKGPSLDPAERRLAIHVEDHPLDYGNFEGTIPAGEYGGGTVMLWDRGRWKPAEDPCEGYRNGKLKFTLAGKKLRGGWMLVRKGGSRAGPEEKMWFLIKERDDEARPAEKYRIVDEEPLSVKTGRDLAAIAAGRGGKHVWSSDKTKSHTRMQPSSAAKQTAREHGMPRGALPGAAKRAARTTRSKSAGRAARTRPGRGPLPGRRAALADDVEVELATLVKQAPVGDDWFHEIKFDGYRILCYLRAGKARCMTRRGQDWTARLGALVDEIERLPVKQALFDGEVVVVESNGRTSFQALQNVLRENRSRDLVYFVFDLLHLDGHDLRDLPLEERKRILAQVIPDRPHGPIRYVEHIVGNGPTFLREACKMGLEGIVSKRRGQPYRPGRGGDWLKTKCSHAEEFVICGFTDPSGGRTGFGALLLAYHDANGRLVYAGRVGTGFSDEMLTDLHKRLKKLEQRQSPLDLSPGRPQPAGGARGRGIHWVKPVLVAQITFSEWTRDGMLRHPSFQGLREDKPAAEVVRDVPLDAAAVVEGDGMVKSRDGRRAGAKRRSIPQRSNSQPTSSPRDDAAQIGAVRLTHPDRVMYPDQGLTKQQLADYYIEVADWMLPHVEGRPLSLVRCPEGQQKQCFYQKHVAAGDAQHLALVDIKEKDKTRSYAMVKDVAGLISLVQMGVLEIHVWGARGDDVERPDRLIMDLDPDPTVGWSRVAAGAARLREEFERLGLQSFVKTTGGKGLHVVVPIRRHDGWDEIKRFCRAVAQRVTDAEHEHYTTNMSKSARRGKIFIDYLRNDRGATSVAAYSTRARPGATVSMPLDWNEIASQRGADRYTVENAPSRLRKLKRDPWKELINVRQSITASMRKDLGVD